VYLASQFIVMKKYFLLLLLVSVCSLSFAQVTATEPDPIILCDVNNPGDQTEIFDLTIREVQIIDGQTNVVVSYHLTSGDALGNGGFIMDPDVFENTSDPQTIFIRVENVNNPNDWEVTTMQLIVPFIPEIVTAAEDIAIIDPEGDGFEVFDLTRDESDVIGGQDPFDFTIAYFVTQADADANINPILDPENYTNTTNPQTIYTRFAPIQDQCEFESYSFDIFADATLTVEDFTTNLFTLYPNPASDRIQVSSTAISSNATLRILNMTGAIVMERQLISNNVPSSFSVEQLPTGVYFIKVTSEGMSQVEKLIKK